MLHIRQFFRSMTKPFVLGFFLWATCLAQTTPPKAESKPEAVVDAGLGGCTADLVITDDPGKPVYGASVRVHIAYGFMNLHKFDLEAGTNAEGKARFIGLPETSKQGLFFRASENNRAGSAFDDPAKTCQAQFTIVLRPRPPDEAKNRSFHIAPTI
jgi:hypothetical protein